MFQSKQSEEEHAAFLQRLKRGIDQHDEASILREIKEYYRLWSEYGQERSAACQLYLEQLKMLLLPTQVGGEGAKWGVWCVDDEDVSVVDGAGGRVLRREAEPDEVRRRHLESAGVGDACGRCVFGAEA